MGFSVMWLISGRAGSGPQPWLHCSVLPHCLLYVTLPYIRTYFHILIGLSLHPILGVRKPVQKVLVMWQLTCTLILFTVIKEFLQMPGSWKCSFYCFWCAILSVREGALEWNFILTFYKSQPSKIIRKSLMKKEW